MSKNTTTKAKAAQPTIAQDLHVDTDLRRLAERCSQLGDELTSFVRRVRSELIRVKDGDQEGVPQIPLFLHGRLPYATLKLLFTEVLPSYPYIRVIQLQHCALDDDDMLILCDFIRTYKPSPDKNPFKIESLEVPGSNISCRGVRHLASLMAENTTITRLVLDFSCLGDLGAELLCDGLLWNGTLTHMSLQYCGIGARGAAALCARVIQSSQVKVLSLRGNPLGEEGVSELGRALSVGVNINSIDIADTRFGASVETVESLCAGIEASTSLENVDIDLNELTPQAAQNILDVVVKNKNIISIALTERMDSNLYRTILETVAKNAKGKKKKAGEGGKRRAKKRAE